MSVDDSLFWSIPWVKIRDWRPENALSSRSWTYYYCTRTIDVQHYIHVLVYWHVKWALKTTEHLLRYVSFFTPGTNRVNYWFGNTFGTVDNSQEIMFIVKFAVNRKQVLPWQSVEFFCENCFVSLSLSPSLSSVSYFIPRTE